MSRRLLNPVLVVMLIIAILVPWSFLSGSALAAYAWNDAQGPGDGDAWGLAWDSANSILYRGTMTRGVWKYQSGTWSQLPGLNLTQVWALAYDQTNNILYAGGSYGVYRCTNPNTSPSWTNTGGGISGSTCHELLYIQGANVLLAGMAGVEGVWGCTNPNTSPSWSDTSNNGIENAMVFSVALDSTNGFLYAASDGGAWRYDSSTFTWASIQSGLTYSESDSIVYDATRNKVYIGMNGGKGVWRCDSPNTAPAWTSIGNNGIQNSNVLAMAYDVTNNVLYASGQPYGPLGVYGIWSCPNPDTAPSWTNTGGGVSGYGSYKMLYLASSNTLYAGTFNPQMYNGRGVWSCATPNTAPSWSKLGVGVSDYSVYCYAYDSSRNLLYAGTSNGVWKCSNPDTAPTWSDVGLSSVDVLSLAYDPTRNLLYAGMGNYYKGVQRCASPDSSPAWTNLGTPINSHEVCSLACDTANDRVYAGAANEYSSFSNGVFRCDSASSAPGGGSNWVTTNLGAQTRALCYDAARGILYAGGQSGLWRCANPGPGTPAWTDITGAMTDTLVESLAYDPARHLLYAGCQGGVWRGSPPDATVGWTKTNSSFMSARGLVYDVGRNDLHAAVYDDGVWHCTTPDTSPSWADTEGILNGKRTRSVACVPNGIIHAGTSTTSLASTSLAMGGYYAEVSVTPNPVPTITSISPTTKQAGGSGFTLTVNGTNFVSNSVVRWNGGDRVTTYVSPTRLTAAITASDLVFPATKSVTVSNPSPGGGSSNSKTFSISSTASTWYLAEGTTAWGFDTYITIENPNQSALQAAVTYMPTGRSNVTETVNLPARSQTTLTNDHLVQKLGGTYDFSTRVVSSDPIKAIAVDRTMSWNGGAGKRGAGTGQEAHSSVGVKSASTSWYMPEGSSKWGFECWLCIQNPNSSKATCQVTYMIEGADPVTKTKEVPANARETYNMFNDIGNMDASIRVTADKPIIPERSMYRNARREGHESIGTTTTATTYYLAEGTTNYGFTAYVCIQNPNNEAADVNLTYMTPGGPVPHPGNPVPMPANSRKTIRVNDFLPNQDFSTRVSCSKPIIAERAMYWDNGTGEACHDSIGISAPRRTFYLPDGQSSDGRETYICVQNPNPDTVSLSIGYLRAGGGEVVERYEHIAGNSRQTFNLAQHSGINGRASVLVTTEVQQQVIIVERAMYWNNRGAGTDTIGCCGD